MKKLILLLAIFCITQAQASEKTEHSIKVTAFVNGSTELKPNQFLKANQYLQSYNRKYKLIYQADGNLVIYLVNGGNLSPVWSSNTPNTTTGKCIMQGDGNLVIYDARSTPVWSSKTWGHKNQGIFAKLRNDGNFVVKRPNYALLWESKSGKPHFYGGSVLYGGQILRKGQRVESNDRKFFLNYQHDGNLVLYRAPNHKLWTADTHLYNTSLTSLFPNGELAVFGSFKRNSKETKILVKASKKEMHLIKDSGIENLHPTKVWSSKSGNRYNKNVRLVVETNGQVVIYSQNRKIWWRPL